MKKVRYIALTKATTEEDVIGAMNHLHSNWLMMDSDQFANELRMSKQSFNMQIRDFQVNTKEMSYQLGKFEGYLEAMTMIHQYEFLIECADKFIKPKEMMYRILSYLYSIKPNSTNIVTLKVSLYNPMKDKDFDDLMGIMVQYGLVTASRTGNNTRYSITEQGVHYYLTHKGGLEL